MPWSQLRWWLVLLWCATPHAPTPRAAHVLVLPAGPIFNSYYFDSFLNKEDTSGRDSSRVSTYESPMDFRSPMVRP